MKHIIISDTHAPQCIYKALNHVQELLEDHSDIDAIVINGDLLGIFSMTSSSIHKGKWIDDKTMDNYLKIAAPKFYAKFKKNGKVTKKMIYEYVGERYAWAFKVLRASTKVKKTIFNLGNHESKIHYLVLNELPFLTKCDRTLTENLDQDILGKIYDMFEKSLYELEEEGNFKYIRDNFIIENETLIVGIPGESHGTQGNDPASIAQEQKTRNIIDKIRPMLPSVKKLIIYNHTQSNYEKETGNLHTASVSLKQFMSEIPSNVTQRIYVQSHNHWSYTQFIENAGFKFIMNNAGLHDGIFNMIEFDEENLDCYDIDPNSNTITKLSLSKNQTPLSGDEELIARFYPDVKFILNRKGKS